MLETAEMQQIIQKSDDREEVRQKQRHPGWKRWPAQLMRFCVVGVLNTALDLLLLNGLLWLFPTTDSWLIVLFNTLAYGVGALNSFFCNKYWTFRHRQRTTAGEVRRFVITTLLAITCNDILIWIANNLFHPLVNNRPLWVNASKIVAIAGTVLVSYLGMRLWVFVNPTHKRLSSMKSLHQTQAPGPGRPTRPLLSEYPGEEDRQAGENNIGVHPSLTVVLPAFNEEQVIASTLADTLSVLYEWEKDFEVIVINDGSSDQTVAIVTAICARDPHVRLITHSRNQGYGAALVSGFSAATKELTFFMDADGQFDIRDLAGFFPYITQYDAVIGYRIERQDTSIRKLNAWGWKLVVGLVLGVHVRDLDCAFKLIRSQFLQSNQLETRGAMINAELLYKLKRAGCTYKEVGVHHLPRRGGKATGANPAVIARAFRELFDTARRWRREQYEGEPNGR